MIGRIVSESITLGPTLVKAPLNRRRLIVRLANLLDAYVLIVIVGGRGSRSVLLTVPNMIQVVALVPAFALQGRRHALRVYRAMIMSHRFIDCSGLRLMDILSLLRDQIVHDSQCDLFICHEVIDLR